MLLWSYEENIKQISSGSPQNNNLLVVFAGIALKLEKPAQSLQSKIG